MITDFGDVDRVGCYRVEVLQKNWELCYRPDPDDPVRTLPACWNGSDALEEAIKYVMHMRATRPNENYRVGKRISATRTVRVTEADPWPSGERDYTNEV